LKKRGRKVIFGEGKKKKGPSVRTRIPCLNFGG